jgi:WD40 repeat protein
LCPGDSFLACASGFLLCALCVLCERPSSALAEGVTGRGGLEAVAVSPDGKRLAVGGQNRVLYLLDAGTLAVGQRLWLGARIGSLAFSSDGKRLAALDDADVLRLLDLEKGKELARVEGVAGLVAGADRVLVHDTGILSKGILRVYSLADLKEQARLEVPYRPAAYAFAASGKQAVLLSASERGTEKYVPATEVPEELTGLARLTFRQRYDGLESLLETRDVATGKLLKQQRLWYTSDSDSTVLARSGEVTLVFNRANICARIAADGTTTLFRTELFLNHGLGVSPDGKRLVAGGSGEGYWGPVEGGTPVKFALDALPGQAEYFARFAVRDDGTAYGVTTACRLVKIGPGGKVVRVVAVY